MGVAAATVKKRPGRWKTLDKIKIPVAFPTHVNLQGWDAQIMNACFQGGGHTDRKEFEWLQNVLDVKEQNMMTLVNVPTEMAEVDKLLVAALCKENWLPPEVARAVLKVEGELLKARPIKGTVTGQMVWWMIHEHFKAMPGTGYLCNTVHLYEVKWQGDSLDQMKRFFHSWEYVMGNMDPKEILSEQALTDILKGCLAKSKVLALEYRLFARLPLGHQDRNPRYVIFQIENYLREKLAEINKASINKAHSRRARG